MSTDGPTLADDSFPSTNPSGGRDPGCPRAHRHSGGHPAWPTAGQEAHTRAREAGGERTGEGAGHDFALPALPSAVDVFDTTLRDGSQQEGLSLTVDDKLRVAEQLDHLGVTFIEGGWPGAHPKDEAFFSRAEKELSLARATLVAFGSTRRAAVAAEADETLRHLVEAGTEAVCIVAKSSEVHVVDALRTSLDEAVAMVADSVEFLKRNELRVFLDAEHFFDGYKANAAFSKRILRAAEEAGVEALVLCDTNGGTLPYEVDRIVADVLSEFDAQVGVHFHNDSGCAVANSLAAVARGATHVQGCVNGYGERAGNTDLSAAIPDLSLKLNVRTIPDERLQLLTPVSHHIAELVNIPPDPQQPFVGTSVFAHKAGLHTSAIARRSDAYEHIAPGMVGNGTRFVVSEMAGRSTLALKADELGLQLDSEAVASVLDSLKRLEHEGYHFEVADGSLELLLRDATGWRQRFFELESYRVIADQGERQSTEATVKIMVGDERIVATAEGNGPVNALDAALREAIGPLYPALSDVHLVDYRVRVLDSAKGTGSVTRVLIDSADGDRTWTTIGVSENVIAASWQALADSIVYGLLHAGPATAPGGRKRRLARIGGNATLTQPSFVPIVEADQVRAAYSLAVPGTWTQSRPSELSGPAQPTGPRLGVPGPDQGYALMLARRFEDRLELGEGESTEDAIAGCTTVAMRRAAAFGRAPVVHDLRFAFTLWGFLGGAPSELVAARLPLFRSASHHYAAQRTIADSVTGQTLLLDPEAVAGRLGEWRELLILPDDR